MSNQTENKSAGVPPMVAVVAGIIFIAAGVFLEPSIPAIPLGEDKIVLGASISMIGMMLLLFPVINYFYVKPLGDAIGERNSNLERTYTEAEDLRAEMLRARKDFETKLAAAEEDNRAKIQAEFAKAKDLAEKAKLEAEANRDSYLENARREIESEKQKLLVELRTSVVEIILAAAEKVIGENMDNPRNRKLVSDFIEKVEVVA